MAAKLAGAGHPVTVIDQGAQLAAIQDERPEADLGGRQRADRRVKAVESAAEAGPQDLVILAVKAHFLDQVVREIDAMLEPDTMVMTIQNGLPWWYFQRHGGAVRRPQAREPRSLGHPHAQDRPGAPDRLRRLSGGAGHRARRDPPRRGRPLPDRRARRQGDRARQVGPRRAGLGRPEVAHPRRHPLRDLAQGLGQSVVQPDQRALARDPGRDLPVPGDPRSSPPT